MTIMTAPQKVRLQMKRAQLAQVKLTAGVRLRRSRLTDLLCNKGVRKNIIRPRAATLLRASIRGAARQEHLCFDPAGRFECA